MIGWGNILLSDEGVGVHALRRLERDYRYAPEVQLVDGGTSGLDLLPLFGEYRRILMLDAVALDEAPGEIRVIRGADIRRLLTQKLSVHHLGVSDVLAVAELLDYAPEEIVLVGIVPEHLELGLELSPTLVARLPSFIETTLSILREWGVRGEQRDASEMPAAPLSLFS
nr:HyaD/HybD family hydrogenase maturation endopeptidase [Thiocystis violacea]